MIYIPLSEATIPLLLRLLLRNMSLDGKTGALGIRRTSFFEYGTVSSRLGSVYLKKYYINVLCAFNNLMRCRY